MHNIISHHDLQQCFVRISGSGSAGGPMNLVTLHFHFHILTAYQNLIMDSILEGWSGSGSYDLRYVNEMFSSTTSVTLQRIRS